MRTERAKAHYLGKDGCKKLNCGQAVISAFKDKFFLGESIVNMFSGYGGGRAPEGVCGAYYAAKYILGQNHSERIKECEEKLLSCAGSTKCKEIRGLKKLSCVGCVEKMAEFVDKV